MNVSYTPAIDTLVKRPEVLSDRYAHVHTRALVNTVEAMGYPLSTISVKKVRTEARVPYAKHLLRFRMPQHQNDEDVPEVIILNSHDGDSPLSVLLGWYRMACANGLIAGDTLASLSFRHVGHLTTSMVQDGIRDLITNKLPLLLEIREAMRHELVSDMDMDAMCQTVNPLVFPKNARPVYENSLLWSWREADKVPTLWNVYNRLQENILKGGQQYLSSNIRPDGFCEISRNSRRAVKGISSIQRLNQVAWSTSHQLLNNAL